MVLSVALCSGMIKMSSKGKVGLVSPIVNLKALSDIYVLVRSKEFIYVMVNKPTIYWQVKPTPQNSK